MKLLAVLLIFTMFTNVLAGECKDPQRECLKLCCDTEQFLSESRFCLELPDMVKTFSKSLLDNNGTKEFVEYGECETQDEFSYIPFCYSPYYDTELKLYTIRKWYSVPCIREFEHPVVRQAKAYAYLIGTSLCFAVMVAFACIKGLKENFIFKLFSCYLATTAVTVIFSIVYHKFNFGYMVNAICQHVGGFLLPMTFLWLNAIGFHIWYGARYGNSRKQRNRFLYTLIYVWGIGLVFWAIIYFKVSRLIDSKIWEFIVGDMLELSIPFFNFIIFLVLSLNICITRCAVLENPTDGHFKSKLFYVILRLFFMMGIPRMIILTTHTALNMNADTVVISFIVEAFMNFIVLLWKPKRCCCFKKSDNFADMNETVHTQITTTNC